MTEYWGIVRGEKGKNRKDLAVLLVNKKVDISSEGICILSYLYMDEKVSITKRNADNGGDLPFKPRTIRRGGIK